MDMPKSAVNWFEIPVADFERAKRFYSAIFDYQMPDMMMGPNRMGILLYDHKAGGVGGCIIAQKDRQPSGQGTTVYLNGGADLSKVLDRVAAAGGSVVTPKMQVSPEIGYAAHFKDSEGNVVGLHSLK